MKIELTDNSNISLEAMLDSIDGESLSWVLLDLEGRGQLDGDESILDIEKKVSESPEGLEISWHQLLTLSRGVDQIIDLDLIGYKEAQECSIRTRHIGIRLIDSSIWEVDSLDQTLAARIRKRFKT